jgi:DNA-binding NtrC family response regulator
MDLHEIDELKRQGRFQAALEALETVRPTIAGAGMKAELLERLGRHNECRDVVRSLLRSHQLTNSQRSNSEYVLSHIALEQGDTPGALAHLQRAASLARGANDLEALCKIQMRLMMVVADLSGPDAAAPILAELRRYTIALGDPQTTAAAHIFVAETEAKRGQFESANRHITIAAGLLDNLVNPWLRAIVENIRLARCVLESNLGPAQIHAVQGRRFAEESGTAQLRRAISANEASLRFQTGDFAGAVECLERALTVVRSSGERRNGCLDTLARIRLMEGRLDEASSLLESIEQTINNDADRHLYANRYALLTRTHLLARQGFVDDALTVVDTVVDVATKTEDRLLRVSGRLTKIELLQLAGRDPEALGLLATLAPELESVQPESYIQYERILACGSLIENEFSAARSHYSRAQRFCDALGIVPPRLELDRRWEEEFLKGRSGSAAPPSGNHSDVPNGTQETLHTIAALLVHCDRPEFVAREVAELVIRGRCAHSAIGRERSNDGDRLLFTVGEQTTEPDSACVKLTLDVRSDKDRTIEIVVEPFDSVNAHATLNSIKQLLATLMKLDRARLDREQRAAIWPADDDRHSDGNGVIAGHMRDTMALAQKVARTTVNVLITGDSGTGKEIVARAIHDYSARAHKPFVPFNCAAVPRDLVESQLFGHRRGAFTGAERDYLGLIRAARDGTLFLDEIGELSLDLQPKLLRFLESGEISPLGENSPIHVNVRIVAATNANLEAAVRAGKFREDLFYRLNVVRLSLKPLRERRDELPALVNHFVTRAACEFGKGRLEVAEETMERLLLYRWPGNVRQLQNELRRMVALAEPNSTLEPTSISDEILRAMPIFRTEPLTGKEIAVRLNDKLLPTLSRVECEMIKSALRDNHGKVDAVAKALGISRKGLYLKRQRLGL